MHTEDTLQCLPHVRIVINNTDGFLLIGHNAASTIEPGQPEAPGRKNQEVGDGDIAQTAGVDLLLNAIHLLFGAAFADPSDGKDLTGNLSVLDVFTCWRRGFLCRRTQNLYADSQNIQC